MFLSKPGSAAEGEPRAKRARTGLANLFMQGKASAKEFSDIVEDLAEVGTEGFQDLAAKTRRDKHKTNLNRTILRHFGRHGWPSLFWYKIPAHKPGTPMEEQCCWAAMLLPHEILHNLAEHVGVDVLTCTGGLDGDAHRELHRMKEETNVERPVCVGIWADSTPYNWDRTESVCLWTLDFPGLVHLSWGSLRIPLVVFPKAWATRASLDEMGSLLAWSMQWSAAGVWPTKRPDGVEWLQSDIHRRKRAGQPLACQGLLLQLRADWGWFKEAWGLPAQNELAGICFKCAATPRGPLTYKDVSETAAWRNNRLSHWQFLCRLHEGGGHLSPIFSAPGLSTSCLRLDWMHVMDEGVSKAFVAGAILLVVPKVPGANNQARFAFLTGELKEWYKAQNISNDSLDKLVPSMVQGTLSAAGVRKPSLSARAAQVRTLIPWIKELTMKWLADEPNIELQTKVASTALNALYGTLSRDHKEPQNMKGLCQTFCRALAQLAEESHLFRLLPKTHLLQEMCEMTTLQKHSLTWLYRDEHFGGTLASYARAGGGRKTPAAVSARTLRKFCALESLPPPPEST